MDRHHIFIIQPKEIFGQKQILTGNNDRPTTIIACLSYINNDKQYIAFLTS